MKRAGELVLIIMLLLAMLCSCVSTRPEGQSGNVGTEGPTETELSETTEPTESEPTEIEPTEPVTEPEEPLGLNQDLIADYGASYSQIRAKRGEMLNHGTAGGGVYYIFENGYGQYFWPDTFLFDKTLSAPLYDENGDAIFVCPKDQLKCLHIKRLKAKDLFNKEFDTLDISEIKNVEGLEYCWTEKDELGAMSYDYTTGFNYGEMSIGISHNDKNVVDCDSEVEIRVQPAYDPFLK